jgi:hypothetical protein
MSDVIEENRTVHRIDLFDGIFECAMNVLRVRRVSQNMTVCGRNSKFFRSEQLTKVVKIVVCSLYVWIVFIFGYADQDGGAKCPW